MARSEKATTIPSTPVREERAPETTSPSVRSLAAVLLKPGHIALFINALAVVGFVWLADSLGRRIDAATEQLNAKMARIDKLESETAALTAQVAGLSKETVSLEGYLRSGAAEDVIFLKAMFLKSDLDPNLGRTIARTIQQHASLQGQDPDLVLAMIAAESGFDPKIVSAAGATGLMQVQPQWKKVLGIEGELTDPEVSIRAGLQILGFYRNMYKDLDMALAAYTRGPGPVENLPVRLQDPSSRYVPRVMDKYKRLKTLTLN